MNKLYCDFCGSEVEESKLRRSCGGNFAVNYGSIDFTQDGTEIASIPYMEICRKCIPIWNRLAPTLIQAVKDEANKKGAPI